MDLTAALATIEPYVGNERLGRVFEIPTPYESTELPLEQCSESSAATRVDKIRTKALCSAACVFFDCTSPYQLEGLYQRSSQTKNNLIGDRANRNKLFERWHSGNSSVLNQVRRANKQATDRIAFVCTHHPKFDALLRSPLWRYLVPSGVRLDEFYRDPYEQQLRHNLVLAHVEHDSLALPDERDVRALAAFIRLGADVHSGVTVLWKWMRTCVRYTELSKYVLLYQTWLELRSALSRDPVFSWVTEDLYRHSTMHFGRMILRGHYGHEVVETCCSIT